jgi:hypothetical protein
MGLFSKPDPAEPMKLRSARIFFSVSLFLVVTCTCLEVGGIGRAQVRGHTGAARV